MKKSTIPCVIEPLFSSEMSCFFGFHDLCQFDVSERYALALQPGFEDRPPGPSDAAGILLCDLVLQTSIRVDETTAWNFPQGARQQWWPGRDDVHVYNKYSDGDLVAVARNLKGEIVSKIPGGIYAFSPDGATAYSVNFARVHYFGGYGYAAPGLPGVFDPCPPDDGIWTCDTRTLKRTLLVSIADVAGEFGLGRARTQFLTHVLPSPSGRQLCFLHRSWLEDGGVYTTICVCGRDGSARRILGQGFYSHFDWADDETILIWGRPTDRLRRVRSSGWPLVGALMRLSRPIGRMVSRRISSGLVGKSSYLLLNTRTGHMRRFLPEFLDEDGHPCVSRAKPGWFVTDTYPDAAGWRSLFIVDLAKRTIHDLGRLGTPALRPGPAQDYLEGVGVGREAIARHGAWSYFRSRSGYSCDFHPRFDRRARSVTIDSIHSGRRQVYRVDVSSLVR
jgi:hypothetical protein